MNLSNPFRSEVGGVSGWINEALDLIMAKINALWNKEHNPDGTHGAITADSANIADLDSADAAFDLATCELLRLADGSVTAPSLAFTNATSSGFYRTQVVAATKINVAIQGTQAVQFGREGGNNAGVISAPDAPSGTGSGAIGPAMQVGRNPGGNGSPGCLNLTDRSGTVRVVFFDTNGILRVATGSPNESSGDLVGVGFGEWNAFTPTRTAATGTWTGGTVTCRYMRVGRTVFVDVLIAASNNSLATATLSITMPASLTANATTFQTIFLNDGAAATATQGLVSVAASATTIVFQKFDGTNLAANTGTLYVRGTFWFETTT